MSLKAGEHQVQLELAVAAEMGLGYLDGSWLIPESPQALLVFSHGAGAPYTHATMQALAAHFAEHELASLRYNFPYMQAGKRRVDAQAVATQTIAEAVAWARDQSQLPTFLAGHSFGGRMNGHAVLEHAIDCQGLIFCSYPLHPPRKPGVERAARLVEVQQPKLFLSGTRDDLADQALMNTMVANLPNAQLHWLDTGNHSYVPLKRTRKHPLTIFQEMAQVAAEFVDAHI